MSIVDRLLRNNIRKLTPYASARSSERDGDLVYLDANENAYAAAAPNALGRYPDPLQAEFKTVVGRVRRVSPRQVFVGNGSDEAIDLMIRAFCRPGRDAVMVMPPTYGMYEVSAAVNDVAVVRAPLDEDFQIDWNAVRANRTADTRIIFLCSPNNPTGNRLDSADVEWLLQTTDGFVVIDEAYIDFSADAGWLPRLSEYDNLVVLQTLSKAWGLANIRIGMAYSSPDVIEVLNRIKPPYNVSGLSQAVAIDAMRNPETMQRHVDRIVTMRGDLEDALLEIEVVKKIYPSEANFLLVRVSDPEEVRAYLRDYGIVVRDRSSMPGCEGCLRITVGTPEQNRRLLEALAAWEVTA